MKIQIENYFGNDILTLIFHEKDVKIDEKIAKEVEKISIKFGYNVADIDVDDDDRLYLRLQEVNCDNSEVVAKTDLLTMVFELNRTYL